MKYVKIFSLLFVCLFAFQGVSVDSLEARSQYRYHKVRKGDTLGKIARRYRTSVRQLRRLNRMRPGSVLLAGKNIRVGTRKAGSSKKRKWKAPRKKMPVGHRWLSNSPHTKVLTPLTYKIPEPFQKLYNGKDYKLRIYAEKFAQGHAGYLEILAPGAGGFPVTESFTVKFHDKKVPLTRARWGYRALFAIPPNRRPGNYKLSIVHSFPSDKPEEGVRTMTRHFTIPVSKTKYRTYSRRVYLGRAEHFKPMKPEIRELIRKSRIKRAEVFALNTGNKITSRLAHPRDLHKVTSPFYVIRKTHQWYRKGGKKIFKKPRVRPHKGLDLRGRWGDPIFAMADGRVAIARRMHYEGNFTVIDHGNQIFTGYMHMSKFDVREGDFVRAGQKLGTSGNTGASRGPHLHLALWIRGVPVQPLSLLSLPIR